MGRKILNEMMLSLALTTLIFMPVISLTLAAYHYNYETKGDFWHGLGAHVWGYFDGSPPYTRTVHKAERFGWGVCGPYGNMQFQFYAYGEMSYDSGLCETPGNTITLTYGEEYGDRTLAGTWCRSQFKDLIGNIWTHTCHITVPPYKEQG